MVKTKTVCLVHSSDAHGLVLPHDPCNDPHNSSATNKNKDGGSSQSVKARCKSRHGSFEQPVLGYRTFAMTCFAQACGGKKPKQTSSIPGKGAISQCKAGGSSGALIPMAWFRIHGLREEGANWRRLPQGLRLFPFPYVRWQALPLEGPCRNP